MERVRVMSLNLGDYVVLMLLLNAQSYFIGKTQRWLKKNTNYKIIVSYADAYHGHRGTIYKATNFKYEGLTSPGRLIQYGDKTYHDKAIRTKYKNKLKPFAQKLRDALESGDATMLTPQANTFTLSS